jgi:hypothetical protein
VFAVCRNRKFEKPYQLYGDLCCHRLKAPHPISDAIVEVKEIEEKARQGIIPLKDCRLEPPRD